MCFFLIYFTTVNSTKYLSFDRVSFTDLNVVINRTIRMFNFVYRVLLSRSDNRSGSDNNTLRLHQCWTYSLTEVPLRFVNGIWIKFIILVLRANESRYDFRTAKCFDINKPRPQRYLIIVQSVEECVTCCIHITCYIQIFRELLDFFCVVLLFKAIDSWSIFILLLYSSYGLWFCHS